MVRRRQAAPGAKSPPSHPFFDVVQDAYRVFACPKPTRTGVCENCCMSPEIEADFFRPAIEDLPLRYLQDWFFAACDPDTGVGQPVWTWLLPRILEVLAVGEEPSAVALELSLGRYETGVRDRWTPERWRVLDRFQRLWLQRAILPSDRVFLDDALCMFARGGWPLEDLLAQVAAAPDDALALRFWNDWCDVPPGRESVWITPFWDEPQRSRVFGFYTSEDMRRRMERLVLAEDAEPALAAKASMVESVIACAGG